MLQDVGIAGRGKRGTPGLRGCAGAVIFYQGGSFGHGPRICAGTPYAGRASQVSTIVCCSRCALSLARLFRCRDDRRHIRQWVPDCGSSSWGSGERKLCDSLARDSGIYRPHPSESGKGAVGEPRPVRRGIFVQQRQRSAAVGRVYQRA